MAKLSDNERIKTQSKLLRGTLAETINEQITGAMSDDDQQLIKFHGSYQQDDRDRRNERLQKKLEPAYSFMIRLRIPAGAINSEQWLAISDITDEYGTGIVKITTRQTVQLHGVLKSKLKPTIADFAKYNLDSIAACGDVNRNVIASPYPEQVAAHKEIFEYADKISTHLLPKTRAYSEIWLDGEKLSEKEEEPLYGETYLPRKFKIAIAVPPNNDTDVLTNDVALIAIVENGEFIGFNVAAGGGMGMTHGNLETYPRLASVLGFAEKDKVLDVVYKIVEIQRDHGNREDRKKSRLKYTVDKFGVEGFKAELDKRLGYELAAAKIYEFTERKDRFGWQQDVNGDSFYGLFIENGRVVDEEYQLATFLKEAAKLNKVNFRFTANQNMVISEVKAQDKALIEALIVKYKIDEYQGNLSALRKNSMACVAFNTCPLALAEGQRYMPSLITKIEPILIKHNLEKQDISIRMTGCPNGCARPYAAEIGLVGKALGEYNLYLGASHKGERLNSLYKESLNEKEILAELENFIADYAKNRKNGESFGDFTNNKLNGKNG